MDATFSDVIAAAAAAAAVAAVVVDFNTLLSHHAAIILSKSKLHFFMISHEFIHFKRRVMIGHRGSGD